MARAQLYSQRVSEQSGGIDVFQYDVLSKQLREQCLYIIADVLGSYDSKYAQANYRVFNDTIKRALGLQFLEPHGASEGGKFAYFVRHQGSVPALDAIELALRMIHNISYSNASAMQKVAVRTLADFNQYCRAAGFGFAWTDGGLIRIDSQLIHAEAVVPALVLLSDPRFKHANEEFRNAHEHWRNGRKSETLVDCLKAFESTMKVIADNRGWAHDAKATAKDLVKLMLDNGIVPPYYQTQFAGLRSVLESGIPTPRNKAGGHGAGVAPPPLPPALVKYVLHQTAATILFLVEMEGALPTQPP